MFIWIKSSDDTVLEVKKKNTPFPTPSFSQPLRLFSSKINQSLNFEHAHLQFS